MIQRSQYNSGARAHSTQRPFQSNEERLVSESLEIADAPAEVISQIRPPLSQVVLFPPRTGFGEYADRVPTIYTAFTTGRWKPDSRNDWSGNLLGSYRSTLRPSTGFAW